MIRTRHRPIIASVLLFGACAGQPAEPPHQHDSGATSDAAGAPTSDLLKLLRRETARFHATEQAIAAGYLPTTHCVATADGAMGMHWGNPLLVDAVFDPAQPEVMLYEPRPNGQPKLVGVEYIVLDVGQPRPEFDGRPFDIRGSPRPAPHWTLHVWLYRDNPNGLFAQYNPTVSCG
jgi:hypothetical protein